MSQTYFCVNKEPHWLFLTKKCDDRLHLLRECLQIKEEMRCVFTRNDESERDALILLSLSLSWFCAKTQRIPDTWEAFLMFTRKISNKKCSMPFS